MQKDGKVCCVTIRFLLGTAFRVLKWDLNWLSVVVLQLCCIDTECNTEYKIPGEAVESLSLELLKSCLDTVMAQLKQDFGPDDL